MGLIIDNFAGAGGASVGIEAAMGRPVDYAINHDPEAIETHEANHPRTRHLVEDVFAVNPAELCAGRPVDLAWFSPDCTHHSRAKGGRPRENKRRGLAWVVIRWAATVRPAVIMLENVPEFQEWGPLDGEGRPCSKRRGQTFRSWTGQLRALGYDVQWRELVAADYGAPTIRKRLFLVARCDGKPIVWPEPTHAPEFEAEGLGLKPWRSAAECIDWTIPMCSIFATREHAKAWAKHHGVPTPKRPLAEASMARIAKGVRRFVIEADRPFFVTYAQHGGANRDAGEPMHTITASGKDQNCVVAPLFVGAGGPTGSGRPRSAGEPLKSVLCENHTALVAAFMTKYYGTAVGADLRGPLPTCTSDGNHLSVSAAFVAKNYGGVVGLPMPTPLGTITAVDHHSLVSAFLCKYHGTGGQHAGCSDPMHCVTCADRMALVNVAGVGRRVLSDIMMRMLQPHELLRAQFGRFAAGYKLIGTKRRQVMGIGNSVCPEVAEALVRANVPARSPTHDRKAVAA